jgi:NDP-sugar pyrophosphorylase family protein
MEKMGSTNEPSVGEENDFRDQPRFKTETVGKTFPSVRLLWKPADKMVDGLMKLERDEVKTAVVLAGGAGLRMQPMTNNQPKVMVRVLDKPILHWVIDWLKHNGVRKVVLGVAHCKEAVMEYFKDGSHLGIEIKYSVHSVEGETGEGFRLAVERHVNDDVFLAMNGDEMTNFNLSEMIAFHHRFGQTATIAVANPRSPFGVVKLSRDGLISAFEEKPLLSSILVSMGIYIFDQSIKDYLPQKGRIEETAFPALVKKHLLRGYKPKGLWLTINTMKDLRTAEDILSKTMGAGKWPE